MADNKNRTPEEDDMLDMMKHAMRWSVVVKRYMFR